MCERILGEAIYVGYTFWARFVMIGFIQNQWLILDDDLKYQLALRYPFSLALLFIIPAIISTGWRADLKSCSGCTPDSTALKKVAAWW